MEISDKIKVKILLSYIGQDVMFGYKGSEKKGQLTGNNEPYGLQVFCYSNVLVPYHNVRPELVKLILKPLYSITDEHAIEISKPYFPDNSPNDWLIGLGKQIAEKQSKFDFSMNNAIFIYQQLQSMGYDMPHYLLNEKTLRECNLAIYQL